MAGMARTVYRPEPGWLEMLNAVRAYIAEHDGQYPSAASRKRAVAALGSWWVSQRMHTNWEKLSANRRAALTDTVRLAREVQIEAKRNRAQTTVAAKRRRLAAPTVNAAARRQVRQAQKQLANSALLPGDREVLQLRIDHPRASMRELAELSGGTMPAFGGKLRRALSRGRR